MNRISITATMAISVNAVFDIGKTNKKFFLFDKNYQVVEKQQTALKQIQDEDGDECEDLYLLQNWIQQSLNSVLQAENFKLQSLNFSAYGASLVHVDAKGKAVAPLYNYLKPYPKELLERFYEGNGGKEGFALETASPPMGMLNSGLQLYWLKHKKSVKYKQVHYSLHFPQYLSSLITGEFVAEQTSIGCHTGLWDYNEEGYHSWLKDEQLMDRLPPVHPVSTTYRTTIDGCAFKTGIGIHDSSAALVPYLLCLDDPFMLVSTGTWSITLNPFNKEPLTYEELRKDCLCYLDIEGNQVKASRLFLGEEYKQQVARLNKHFGTDNQEKEVELEESIINRMVKNETDTKLQLTAAFNSGPYPQDKPGEWPIEKFSSFREAYHQLMLDLVSIQVKSIELAQGSKEVKQLIVSGGFSQNDFFMRLLASFLPEKEIFTASLSNASAMGAAMVINNTEEDFRKERSLLGLKKHLPVKNLEVNGYRWKSHQAG